MIYSENPLEMIEKVKNTRMKVGIAIKPQTPVENVIPYCHLIDMVLVMTVGKMMNDIDATEPGFGGQAFMESCLPKVSELRCLFPNLDIEVDGGIGPENIELAAKAGANVIVAGTSIFKSPSPQKTIQLLRQTVSKHQ
jgi:ribulose-phosphate 3-epimerase